MACDRPNVPLADELADVRDKLRSLKQREDEIRRIMLTDPSARTGAKYAVEVKDVSTTRTDLKELKANYPEIAEQFTYKLTEQRVELRAIDQETGELTRARRKTGTEQ